VIPVLAVALLAVILVPTGAQAQAQVNGRQIFDFPWDARFPNPCNRERLFCTGNAQVTTHGVTDADGSIHLVAQLRNEDTHCIGVDSGIEYRWIDGANARLHGLLDCDGTACSLTEVRTSLWVSNGPEPNFRQQLKTTLIINANGEVILDEDTVSLSCE
jgi:hypothetical protein